LGELRPEDGTYYSRLERRQYYGPTEKGGKTKDGEAKKFHIAKTPLHTARWAVQAFTQPGDWVLDPTIGAGTTAVESLTQGRNVAGMELEYSNILRENISLNMQPGLRAEVAEGDARNIGSFLDEIGEQFSLVVNGPPYSGDESMPSPAKSGLRSDEIQHKYDASLPNIAFLKEGSEYWQTMRLIYGECIKRLKPGGHFVITIKEMMRKKKPSDLHIKFNEMMENELNMGYVGTAFLRHYPGTMFMHTYPKMYNVPVPLYQTLAVFKKP
jgi:DNA modification methylase